MFSFQNAWPTKRKAAYSLVLFYIHFLVACENQIGSQPVYFLKVLFSKPPDCCRWQEVLLQAVNFTGYHPIR